LAKIKLGTIVHQVSGTVGGVTYASAPGSVVVRQHVAGRRGTRQRLAQTQARFAHLMKRWSVSLTDGMRLGWRLATVSQAAGLNAYVAGNLARLNAGLPIQDTPPRDLAPSALVVLGVVASVPDKAALSFLPAPLAPGFRLYLYARSPTSLPVIVRSSDMAFLGVSPGGLGSPFDVGPLLVDRFGPLQEGFFLHLFVRVLKDDGGVLGPGLVITGAQAQVGPFVPPVEGDFMLPTITTHDRLSVGVNLAAGAAAAPAAASWGTADLVELVPFTVTRNFTVATVFWYNGSAVAGSVQVGVYDSSFNLVFACTPASQAGVNALQLVSVTPALLIPGQYFLALGASLSTATFFRSSLSVTNRYRALGALQATASFPMPASVSPVAVTGLGPRLYGISELAGIF
jgi:hypothetical protein